jgi:glycosyltransferase involved in cell wall biosynthesis
LTPVSGAAQASSGWSRRANNIGMVSALFIDVYATAFAVESPIIPARKARPKLSIVMPCLNEAETLDACIRKARNALAELAIAGEVLIADNGSTDGSQEIARLAGARVVDVTEKGYGSALRGGMSAALGQWIVIGDADDSYDFGSIAPFVEKLEAGYDLVMGCRLPRGKGRIMKGAMPWKHRWIGNPLLTFLGRLFFKSRANDFHCGLRAVSKEGFLKMNLISAGMEFASEMVMKATFAKLRVAEVPITLHKDGRSRAPHLRSWRDGWRHLRFMLLHCPMWLFCVPAIILFTAGLAFGIRLLVGPLVIGNVGFDTNTLLVCAMAVIIGQQIATFGLFARKFASLQGILPRSERLEKILSRLTLEKGLIAGVLLVLFGLVTLVVAFLSWRQADYGGISYPQSLRMVIPAVTLTTTGVQLCFSSFFFQLLAIASNSRI